LVAVSEDAVARASPPAVTWLHRYLLVLRMALLNIVAFGLLAAVLLQGWLDGAADRYTGWLCMVIFTVFLFGLGACFTRSFRVSRELNDLRAGCVRPGSRVAKYLSSIAGRGPESRSLSANMLRMRLGNYISLVRHTANSLVFLGLVGTVIGFIIALSAVDPQSSIAVDKIAPMVTTLIHGMSIALYTTLLGAVLHLWLMVNYRMLSTGTMHLYNTLVDFGERHVGK
jgi:hypothetical protein